MEDSSAASEQAAAGPEEEEEEAGAAEQQVRSAQEQARLIMQAAAAQSASSTDESRADALARLVGEVRRCSDAAALDEDGALAAIEALAAVSVFAGHVRRCLRAELTADGRSAGRWTWTCRR